MRIPTWPIHDERETELLRAVLESGRWGGFNEVVGRFEQSFAAFQQCAHGVAAVNGTVTLETALAVCGIGPGDEVIVPAISFISSATAVSRAGALPVFVDIEPFTFNMDPARAAAAITPRTKAIMVVHFGGLMADMDCYTRLAAERNLILLEDAAHAHGSEWNGKRAGSFGLAGSFSFQNSKVMTSGEGGMLTTNDAAFAARARAFVNQGRREGQGWFFHYTLGTNFRMAAFEAAVLTAQLERLPGQIATRKRNARLLRSELADVAGLRFQDRPPQATAHSEYLLLGRIEAAKFGMSRDDFHAAVTAAGIPCTPFYPHTLYGNPMYQAGGAGRLACRGQAEPPAPLCRVEPCPVSEACIRDAFWFPHRVLLAEEATIREIAQAIRGLAA